MGLVCGGTGGGAINVTDKMAREGAEMELLRIATGHTQRD